MKTKQIIEEIKNQKELYLNEVIHAKNRLNENMNDMTSHQINEELQFIQDMESRAYALQILLEDINMMKGE